MYDLDGAGGTRRAQIGAGDGCVLSVRARHAQRPAGRALVRADVAVGAARRTREGRNFAYRTTRTTRRPRKSLVGAQGAVGACDHSCGLVSSRRAACCARGSRGG